jgi:Fis family transcriptional regulator
VGALSSDVVLNNKLTMEVIDQISFEQVVEYKISRFFDQIGTYYPDNLHSLFMDKVEKVLIKQLIRRTGGNQLHTSRVLGINRNTLRKKIKEHGIKY